MGLAQVSSPRAHAGQPFNGLSDSFIGNLKALPDGRQAEAELVKLQPFSG